MRRAAPAILGLAALLAAPFAANATSSGEEGASATAIDDSESTTTEEPVSRAAEEAEEKAATLGREIIQLPSRLYDDVRSLPTLHNAALLALGGTLAAISTAAWDESVRDEIASGPRRFGKEMNSVLDNGGESLKQLAAVSALWATSALVDEPRLRELSSDAFRALAIEIPLVIGLKHAFNSTRPDGARRGFPSGHVASTATLAAAAHRHFGPLAGTVGALFTAAVAFHRMDTRHHDLSDVIFGAAIGYVIGSTAARPDADGIGSVHFRPFPGGAQTPVGLLLEWRF